MTKKRMIRADEPIPERTTGGEMGYSVGRWAGLTQYKCKQCPFDTLDLDAMLEHLLKQHSVLAVQEPMIQPSVTGDALKEPGEVAQGIYEVSLEEVLNGTTNVDTQDGVG